MRVQGIGMVALEVCVDSADGLQAAIEGGADRIELCSALELGGLTPGPGLIRLAQACPVPMMVMIRPRAGDFVWSRDERQVMTAEIATMRDAGLAGVVIGANRGDGCLDVEVLGDLVAAAKGLDITLHRSVDVTPDPVEAVRTAAQLGIGRVLSSGGAERASAGLPVLSRMVEAGAGRVSVMPGAGVSSANVTSIVRELGVSEVHSSCSVLVTQSDWSVALGFSAATRGQTDVNEIRAMKAELAKV